jgi:type III restriction enzyme
LKRLLAITIPIGQLSITKTEKKNYTFILETKLTDVEAFLRPEEQAKIKFARKYFEAINVDVLLEGPENDVDEFMLKVSS